MGIRDMIEHGVEIKVCEEMGSGLPGVESSVAEALKNGCEEEQS